MTTKPKQRGGAREGAGRKPLDDDKKRIRKNVTLLPGTIKFLKSLNEDNELSAGIELAAASLMQRK